MAHQESNQEVGHGGGRLPPTTIRQYVYMGVILTVFTAIEFLLVEEREIVGRALVPLLLIFTAAKFVVVVAFFMHLRWDHPLLRRMFSFGFVLATAILLALLALFWTVDTVLLDMGGLIPR